MLRSSAWSRLASTCNRRRARRSWLADENRPSRDGGDGTKQQHAHGRCGDAHPKRQAHGHRRNRRGERGEHDGQLEERGRARERCPHHGQVSSAGRTGSRVCDSTADRWRHRDGKDPVQGVRRTANEHPEAAGEDQGDDDAKRPGTALAVLEKQDGAHEEGAHHRVERQHQTTASRRGVLEEEPDHVAPSRTRARLQAGFRLIPGEKCEAYAAERSWNCNRQG